MNTINTLLMTGALAALSATGASAQAQGGTAPAAPAAVTPTPREMEMADAEVRKIDIEQGKVTLRHGTIKNLDMPPMTMVFAVKDKAVLERFKPGDKVRFRAEDANGQITVVEMIPAR